jgi:NAD(P)-dependent dehydrogenase (short-subunit alcohol dehydrogenase family)
MENKMENKVVVITGGSRGLGESMARLLASKKAKVVISGRDKKDLERIAKDIGALAIAADVTKENEVTSLAEQVVKQYGQIDIWINNAGVWLPRATLEATNMDEAHKIFEVNFFGTAYGCRAAIHSMKKQKKGMIVNIVSSSALVGRPNQVVYSSSKHAAKGLTDSIREELKDSGIMVIGVYPGGIKTHLFDKNVPDDFDAFMTPEFVAGKIIENLEMPSPIPEQILKRPGQS